LTESLREITKWPLMGSSIVANYFSCLAVALEVVPLNEICVSHADGFGEVVASPVDLALTEWGCGGHSPDDTGWLERS